MVESEASPEQLLKLEEENRQLRRAVEELSVLNDLARTIGGALDTDDVIRTIVRRSLSAVGAEQGVVTLAPRDEESIMRTLLRTNVSSAPHERYRFDQSLLGWMQLNMKPLLIADPVTDERFRGVSWDESIHTLLSVPMTVRSRLIAVLTVFNKRDSLPFNDDDKRLLSIIASQSAQVVENARLHQQERELQQMQHEVELASVIQQKLLPTSNPAIPGYDIAGSTSQAKMVGGDYFDFIPRSDGRLTICLGDVVGKGLGASLLMSNVHATLRTQSMGNASISESLGVANHLLFDCTDADKYVTLFCALLDPANHTIEYSNAGHTRPLLLRNNQITRLEERAVMLGLTANYSFPTQRLELHVGDVIVIYSDGITEAVDQRGKEFGEDGLRELLLAHREKPAEEIIERIVDEVNRYTAESPRQDDTTLIIIKRN
jgi:sigma-B regulation protein RsbU (phosphoserine phosphatase)